MANTQHTALYISALVCIIASTIEGRVIGEENSRLNRVLSQNRYSKYDYPNAYTNNSTQVELGIYVTNMCFKEESTGRGILDMNVYFRQKFEDPRLEGAVEQGDVVLSRDPWRKFWVPDTFVPNADYVRVTQDKDIMKTNLYRISSDAKVFYVTSLNIGIPYREIGFLKNERIVTVKFESFAQTEDEITFAWINHPLELDPSLQIQGYALLRFIKRDCSQTFKSGTFPCLSVTFHFKKD